MAQPTPPKQIKYLIFFLYLFEERKVIKQNYEICHYIIILQLFQFNPLPSPRDKNDFLTWPHTELPHQETEPPRGSSIPVAGNLDPVPIPMICSSHLDWNLKILIFLLVTFNFEI